MDLYLKDKKALITGASRGIGLAIAKGFLEEGAKTCIVSRGSENLFSVQKEIQSKYGAEKSFAVRCDCTSSKSLILLKEEILKKWNALNIVVVNVGDGESVEDILPDDKQWKKIWKINFESALQTARTFLPILEKSEGCLLFVSSITGKEAFGAPTDYSTAKSAIIALAKNMARKLASKRVRVNVIAPGNVYFKVSPSLFLSDGPKKRVNKVIQSTVPMKRFGTPAEIANSAVFLCSDRASFITGTTLVVDGGQTVGVF